MSTPTSEPPLGDFPEPSAEDGRREIDVRLSRHLARLMDDLVTVPGTKQGLGLDALIGLIPGIGDVVGSTVTSLILYDAIRARVPMSVLVRMAWNLIVDAALGVVPFAGDALDVVHRANRKNFRLLEGELEREPLRQPPTVGYVLGAIALTIIPALAGLIATVLLIIWLVRR